MGISRCWLIALRHWNWRMQKNPHRSDRVQFLGFSRFHEQQITSSWFFFLYITLAYGNAVIVSTICIDHHLHTPMHFFLRILASSKTTYTLVTIPRTLWPRSPEIAPISLAGCTIQIFFFSYLSRQQLLSAHGEGVWSLCGHLVTPWDTHSSWARGCASSWWVETAALAWPWQLSNIRIYF